jgi:hypothetical protein
MLPAAPHALNLTALLVGVHESLTSSVRDSEMRALLLKPPLCPNSSLPAVQCAESSCDARPCGAAQVCVPECGSCARHKCIDIDLPQPPKLPKLPLLALPKLPNAGLFKVGDLWRLAAGWQRGGAAWVAETTEGAVASPLKHPQGPLVLTWQARHSFLGCWGIHRKRFSNPPSRKKHRHPCSPVPRPQSPCANNEAIDLPTTLHTMPATLLMSQSHRISISCAGCKPGSVSRQPAFYCTLCLPGCAATAAWQRGLSVAAHLQSSGVVRTPEKDNSLWLSFYTYWCMKTHTAACVASTLTKGLLFLPCTAAPPGRPAPHSPFSYFHRTFADREASTCRKCPRGYYATTPASTSCSPCGAETFAPLPGSWACIPW